jgi:hypothetical protein
MRGPVERAADLRGRGSPCSSGRPSGLIGRGREVVPGSSTPAWGCAPSGTRLPAGGSARGHGTGRPETRSMRATAWRQWANRRWPLASARSWAAGGTSGVWHRARNAARSDIARRASTPPRTAARSSTYRSNVATRRCSVSASNTWITRRLSSPGWAGVSSAVGISWRRAKYSPRQSATHCDSETCRAAASSLSRRQCSGGR